MICNQHDIPKEVHRYGLRASAETGCGWIATYNALKILGCTTDIDELIRYFEWQLPLIHGNFGTAFWAPRRCFDKWGFPNQLIFDRKRFDGEARQADACIVFYHWVNKGKAGAHFAALKPTTEGFTGYNTFRDSIGPDNWGKSIDAFLRGHRYFGCVLLVISGKQVKKC